ncbi:MAG: hypothetical protein CBD58_02945 [bacterium TMED198]|nr:MAG: hypothetical protein CBD58_02945 [bacterium TMED198]
MDILNKVMNDPILMGVAVLIAILVVFSILKKLFKFLGVVIAIAVLYVLYLTQVEGMSYEDATDETMQKGKELIEGAKETIKDLQYDIPEQGQ